MSRWVKTNDVFYKNAADKIRELTEKDVKYYPSEIPNGIQTVYDAGYEARRRKYWEDFTADYTRTKYYYGLGGEGWNPYTFDPPQPLFPVDARAMFYAARISSVSLSQVNFSKATDLRQAFYACTDLESIEFLDATSLATSTVLTGTLQNCSALKTLILKVSTSTGYNDTFRGCSSLENLRFEVLSSDNYISQNGLDLSSCQKLTAASLKNVIESLSPTTQNLKVILPVNAAELYGEGWDEVVALRQNWTIGYGV